MMSKVDMADKRAELDVAEIERYLAAAMEMADEVRSMIKSFITAGFRIDRKQDQSFVTSADLEVEQRLREMIGSNFPEHGIVGEEFATINPHADFQWILDPIDGTEDFAHGVATFGTIVGLHYKQWPIVGVIDHPALDMRVSGAFGLGAFQNGSRIAPVSSESAPGDGGVRMVISARANFTPYDNSGPLFDALVRRYPNHRIYRSCYGHTLAITGHADVMVEYGNHIWDLAASQILIEEAGGKYVTVQHLRLSDIETIYGAVFGRPALVDDITGLIRRPDR